MQAGTWTYACIHKCSSQRGGGGRRSPPPPPPTLSAPPPPPPTHSSIFCVFHAIQRKFSQYPLLPHTYWRVQRGTFVWSEVGGSPCTLSFAWQDNFGKWKNGLRCNCFPCPPPPLLMILTRLEPCTCNTIAAGMLFLAGTSQYWYCALST